MTPVERVERLRARVRAQQTRLVVRRWEARQVATSKGTWYRLRRALAFAEYAYAIDAADVTVLLAEGWARAPVGDELEPARDYLFVSRDRASQWTLSKRLPLQLSPDFLAQPHVMLVPFDGITPT